MKHCGKWMIVCLVGALAIAYFLPKLGVPLVGASLLVTLLMVGCCVIPMGIMMFGLLSGKKDGGCCAKKDLPNTSPAIDPHPVNEKPACH